MMPVVTSDLPVGQIGESPVQTFAQKYFA